LKNISFVIPDLIWDPDSRSNWIQ